METSQGFDWAVLFPNFVRDRFVDNQQNLLASDAVIITDFFIFLILLFFLVCAIGYAITFARYIFSISSFQQKIENLLKHPNNLIESWDSIKYSTPAFRAFDESLTTYNGKLYANQDVETYFSAKTLAPSLLHSKIFPFMSVLLTGLGVLGTFTGLLIGLSGLELDGNTSRLQGEIRLVAQGASIAFITSVYGVAFSLILNLFEKTLSAIINRKIIKLQLDMSVLFPAYPAMDVFLDIKRYEEESKDLLGGLAEQIGNSMQQSLDNFSHELSASFAKTASDAIDKIAQAVGEGLTTSIRATLVPAVEQISASAVALGEKQAESSTDALQALVQQFVSSIGEEGDNQRQAMHKVSDELSASLANFSIAIKDMIAEVGVEQRKIFEAQEGHMSNIRHNMHAIAQQQTSTLNALSSVITKHVEATEGVITQGISLNTSANKTNEALEKFATQIGVASQSMSTASEHLHSFSDNIHDSIERSAQSVDNAMEISQDVARIHKDAAEQFISVYQGFMQLRNSLMSGTEHINQAITTAQQGFTTLVKQYEELQANFRNHTDNMGQVTQQYVKELDEHMVKLLENYSKLVNRQVDERMTEWDRLTKEFCESIKNVVNAMSEHLDDLKQHPLK